MTDGFSVAPAAWRGVADGIGQLLEQLTTRARAGLAEDVVGHGGLASALTSFDSRWELGVRHLAEDGKRFAGGLTRCMTAYEGVEGKIARSMAEAGS